MAGTLSSTGTWSTIATAERPTASRDTIDQRFGYETMNPEDGLRGNAGGFPELMQFIALFADAYDVPANAALVRITIMCEILMNRSTAPEQRVYTP